MKNLLTVFLLTILSCDTRYGVEVVVHNDSKVTIDSVLIKTSDGKSDVRLVEVQEGQSKSGFLDMAYIDPADGNYVVEISAENFFETAAVGYYSNGTPLETRIDIYYESDTVIYDFQITDFW